MSNKTTITVSKSVLKYMRRVKGGWGYLRNTQFTFDQFLVDTVIFMHYEVAKKMNEIPEGKPFEEFHKEQIEVLEEMERTGDWK